MIKQGRDSVEDANVEAVRKQEQHVVAVCEQLADGLQEVRVQAGAEIRGGRRRRRRSRLED